MGKFGSNVLVGIRLMWVWLFRVWVIVSVILVLLVLLFIMVIVVGVLCFFSLFCNVC